MFENLLDEALAEFYKEDFLLDIPAKEYKMPFRRVLAMKKIFRLYKQNVGKLYSENARLPSVSERKFVLTPRRVLLLVMIVFLAAFTGCSVHYIVTNSFRGAVYSDNAKLFNFNLEDCPAEIEEKYYLPDIPEEYEVLLKTSCPLDEYIYYMDNKTGKYIAFGQYVKDKSISFNFDFDTEKGEMTEADINGHKGILLDFSSEGQDYAYLIWDCGDYILTIDSNLAKEELLNLAKSAKTLENQKN